MKDRKINTIVTFTNELAYNVDDAVYLLGNAIHTIVLGGDILIPNSEGILTHESSNWSYDINPNLSNEENINTSIEYAVKYLQKIKDIWTKTNLDSVYVVLVVK